MFARCTTRLGGRTPLDALSRGSHRVTRLANGLRVMTYEDHTAVTGIALYTRMGARYETETTAGSTAVLAALAMRPNRARDEATMCRDLHALGASFRVNADIREIFGWSMNVPRYHVKEGLRFVADAALRPSFDPANFEIAKTSAQEQSVLADRDSTRVCFEMVHQAAFGKTGIGRPLWHEADVVGGLSPGTVELFHATLTQPDRAVLVASGVSNHDEFLDDVEKALVFPERPSGTLEYSPDEGYTGGRILVQNDKAPESITKFAEKNLTHTGLCFRGIPLRHPDYFVYTVIQTLLGGGTSFSSGGPGKGMHTKLFREVVFRAGWVHGVECISAWYEKGGLIGLYGQAEHGYSTQLLNMMLYQASTIPARISEDDVEMAKNQLMSQLVLLGESRDVSLEEASKLLLQHDRVMLPADLLKGAEKVTLDDIRRVSKDLISTPPTLVVYGNTEKMPDLDTISRQVRSVHAKYCERA